MYTQIPGICSLLDLWNMFKCITVRFMVYLFILWFKYQPASQYKILSLTLEVILTQCAHVFGFRPERRDYRLIGVIDLDDDRIAFRRRRCLSSSWWQTSSYDVTER